MNFPKKQFKNLSFSREASHKYILKINNVLYSSMLELFEKKSCRENTIIKKIMTAKNLKFLVIYKRIIFCYSSQLRLGDSCRHTFV